MAAAVVVMTSYTDCGPFGFVFDAPIANYVKSGKASFTLCQDMGWVADGLDD